MRYRWAYSVTDADGNANTKLRRQLNRQCQPALTSLIITDPRWAELVISLYNRDDKFRQHIDSLVTAYARTWLVTCSSDTPDTFDISVTLLCETDANL